jgi:hypothetical protein
MAQGRYEERRPMAAQGRRGACTAALRLGGRRGVRGRVAHARWGRNAVAWRFPAARTSEPTAGLCGDPANHGAAAATPVRARALWSARVPTQLSLALFRRVFSQTFPTKVVQVLNSKVVDQLTVDG